jgi:uncharacterized protein GlcG (DUF336 family)
MTKPSILLLGVVAVLAAAGAVSAQPAPAAMTPPAPPAKGPATALALEAAQEALATCTANGYKVAVSVIDSAGVTKVVLAGDGVRAMGVVSSGKKADASLMYKMPTAALDAQTKTDADLAAKIKADASLMARAGAEPLMSGGEVIGAIGVGGAPGGEKDDVCALAGLAKIKDRL